MNGVNPVWGQETDIELKQSGRENEFSLSPPILLYLDPHRLDDAHPQWEAYSALLSLPAGSYPLSTLS